MRMKQRGQDQLSWQAGRRWPYLLERSCRDGADCAHPLNLPSIRDMALFERGEILLRTAQGQLMMSDSGREKHNAKNLKAFMLTT
jgi:hypothetical protein